MIYVTRFLSVFFLLGYSVVIYAGLDLGNWLMVLLGLFGVAVVLYIWWTDENRHREDH